MPLNTKTIKKIVFLAVLVSLTNCVVLDETNRKERQRLTRDNIQKLEGLYSVQSQNKEPGLYYKEYGNLYNNFKLFEYSFDTDSIDLYTVGISVLRKNKIKVDLYKKGGLVRTNKKRGKIKDDYFYCKSQFVFFPFFPVFLRYNAQRQRIAFKDNLLIVDYKTNYTIFFLVAGHGDIRQTRWYYEKIR